MNLSVPGGINAVIVFIIAALLGSAFLSFLKTALACCRRARLTLLMENGGKKYSRALKLLEKTGVYQASLRAGIVFFEILLGCLAGMVVINALTGNNEAGPGVVALWLVVCALVSGAIFFVFAETIPRAIARLAPEQFTAFFSGFIKALPLFHFPLLEIEKAVSNLIRKFQTQDNSSSGMTEDELHIALLEGEKSGIVESRERTMVEGVFYLGDRPVGAFMTHRSDVSWLDISDTPKTIREIIGGFEQQYFPVADGDLDKVSGIVSVREILLALLREDPWQGLASLSRTPCFVPETMPALKAFETFKKAETNCLFVMDEYGGFAGILTVRNLIEEIVGQLSAKTGDEEEIVRQEDGTLLVDGSINIDSAAQALSLSSLAEDADHADYHTLAGFILNLAGEIPRTGAHFDFHGYRFTIVDMDGNRIDKVMIRQLGSKNPPAEEPARGER